jgi:hypothetical protein
MMHLVDFGPAVFFGLFYLIRGDINISRLRSLTSPEAVEHAVEDEPIADAARSGVGNSASQVEEDLVGS